MPKLPKWSDPGSVATFLFALAATATAIVRVFHPAASDPALEQALLPLAGFVSGASAIAANLVTHRKAHSAAVAQQGFTLPAATSSFTSTPAPVVNLDELAPKIADVLDKESLAQDLEPFLTLLVTSKLGQQ